MSKRSYRRLAVVTGAALALGSMAPAVALRVDTADAAGVSVETLDITDVTGSLPVNQLLPTNLVFATAGSLFTTVQAAPGMVIADVQDIVGDALCIPTGVAGAALGLTAGAGAGGGVGLGGVNLALAGVASAPIALVGGGASCAGALVGDVLGTVGGVQAIAGSVAGTATVVAGTVVGSATTLVPTVVTTAGGLLNPAGPLGSILNVQAAGSASVLASLLGTF